MQTMTTTTKFFDKDIADEVASLNNKDADGWIFVVISLTDNVKPFYLIQVFDNQNNLMGYL